MSASARNALPNTGRSGEDRCRDRKAWLNRGCRVASELFSKSDLRVPVDRTVPARITSLKNMAVIVSGLGQGCASENASGAFGKYIRQAAARVAGLVRVTCSNPRPRSSGNFLSL